MTLTLEIGIGLAIGLVVGALGGGGGVLTVPALVYLLGASTHEAAAASLVIVGVAALTGLPVHARRGHVRWGAGVVFGSVGTVSAVAGAVLARDLDPSVLLLAFAGVITVAAVLMIRDARRGGDQDDARSPPAALPGPALQHFRALRWALVVLGGLAVGLTTGLFGVGGGFLAVPVLVLVLRWPARAAIGTSLLVIVINSIGALVPRLGAEALDARLVVPVTAAAVTGTVLGKLVADRVSTPSLSRVFAALLLLLAAYTAVRSSIALAG